MLPKSSAPGGNKSPSDARLLHDIETLSKALSLPSPSTNPPKKPKQQQQKKKKKPSSSSFWANFNPIRSLLSSRRVFPCRFSLHVHSVNNLPPFFSSSALSVHWRRSSSDPSESSSLSTRPASVFNNSAQFDEILICCCSVHGSSKGSAAAAKYAAKHFLVSVKDVECPDLDLGKNLVDLTRLLPLSLDELEEGSIGKWSTSFRLAGKAKGASLNVSFGFSIGVDGEEKGDERKVGRVESSDRSRDRARSVEDVRVLHEVLPCSKLEEASTMSDFEKMRDLNLDGNDGDEELLKGVEVEGKERIGEPELVKSECKAEEPVEKIEFEAEEVLVDIERNQSREKFEFEAEVSSETELEKIDFVVEEVVEDTIRNWLCENMDEEREIEKKLDLELNGLDSILNSPSNLEWEKKMGSMPVEPKTPGHESYTEMKSRYKAGGMKSKSVALDDETVAGEFLRMLGIDHSPFGFSSDSDPESPREQLWRQFQKESSSNGISIFDKEPTWMDGDFADDIDLASMVQEAEMEFQLDNQSTDNKVRAKMMEDAETQALMRQWGINEKAFHCSPPNSRGGFGSPVDIPPEEPLELPPLGEGLGPFVKTKDGGFLRSMSPSLFSNAKNDGSLIMQVSSPVVVPAEMGSGIMEILQRLASVGIEKLSMQAKKLMPLEEINGRTMQQLAWEAAPALESCKRKDISQHLKKEAETRVSENASKMSKQNRRSCSQTGSGGEVSSEYVSLEDLAPLAMDKIEALSIEGLRIQSGMSEEEAPSNISPQSIGNISALEGKGSMNNMSLGLEGTGGLQLLDVQDSGDVDGLMGLSITLDEWMRLDSGEVDEDVISDQTSKILAAHHAHSTEMTSGGKGGGKRSGRKWGLLGNSFTVALMVQLRDPLRNYESVGNPMLSLIQVERVFIPPKPKLYSAVSEKGNSEEQYEEPEQKTELVADEEKKGDENVVPQFKITEVHVAGIKTERGKKKLWGNPVQQQSGSRWLLASGMGKSNKHPFMKSKVVSKPAPVTTTVQPGDTLWSISSRVHGNGAKWKELLDLNPHIRNPNVIFPNETIRLQ